MLLCSNRAFPLQFLANNIFLLWINVTLSSSMVQNALGGVVNETQLDYFYFIALYCTCSLI